MPRFVILEHDYPSLHWDLMLECGERLRTWRLPEAPEIGRALAATPLADHRVMYLDYEGEVSGGRGHVVRWDRGDFDWIDQRPDWLELRFMGVRVRGRVYLCRVASGDWRFTVTSNAAPDSESAF